MNAVTVNQLTTKISQPTLGLVIIVTIDNTAAANHPER